MWGLRRKNRECELPRRFHDFRCLNLVSSLALRLRILNSKCFAFGARNFGLLVLVQSKPPKDFDLDSWCESDLTINVHLKSKLHVNRPAERPRCQRTTRFYNWDSRMKAAHLICLRHVANSDGEFGNKIWLWRFSFKPQHEGGLFQIFDFGLASLIVDLDWVGRFNFHGMDEGWTGPKLPNVDLESCFFNSNGIRLFESALSMASSTTQIRARFQPCCFPNSDSWSWACAKWIWWWIGSRQFEFTNSNSQSKANIANGFGFTNQM